MKKTPAIPDSVQTMRGRERWERHILAICVQRLAWNE